MSGTTKNLMYAIDYLTMVSVGLAFLLIRKCSMPFGLLFLNYLILLDYF